MGNFLQSALTSPRVSALMNFIVGHYATIYMIHRPQPDNGAYEGLSPELLNRCLEHAKKSGFEFAYIDDLVLDALAGKKPQRPTICFTLDDGYQDQVDQLVPVLLRHQAKPTLYVINDLIDQVDWPWDTKLSYALWQCDFDKITFQSEGENFQLDLSTPTARILSRRMLTRFGKTLPSAALNRFVADCLLAFSIEIPSQAPTTYQPASWDSLRKAEEKGLRIGSHACSHRVFSALSDNEIREELQRSNLRLNQEVKFPSRVFCYPSGTARDFSPHHIDLVQQAGFIAALTSIPGNIRLQHIREAPFDIKRHSFPNRFETFVRYSSWLEYIRSSI